MLFNVTLIIIGFGLLVKGANWLVDGASEIAKKFHISEMIIGLTIVSIGTSMPELFISSTSVINGYYDLSIGNVIGSSLCNLLLILGISAIINPISLKKETRHIEIPICLVITIIFLILCNIGTEISRTDGIILIFLFICFILYTIYIAKKNDEINLQIKKSSNIMLNIMYIVLGVIALKFGGDFVVDNAKIIAYSMNVSERIISLTIIAVGTSLPELVTSIVASIKRNSDIAIGNIVGSNIFNFLLVIGTSSLIKPISYDTSYNWDMTILITSTVILEIFPYTNRKNEMTYLNGIIYLIIYICYIYKVIII